MKPTPPRPDSARRVRAVHACAAAACVALMPLAHAETNVQLYGLVDAGIGRFKPPGVDSSMQVASGLMSTSYFGVRGYEDLGTGLTALFAVESFMRLDTGNAGRFANDPFWARNAYVGLRSDAAGQIALGRTTTPMFVNALSYNPFGDSFGFSPIIRMLYTTGAVPGGAVIGDTGWSNTVQYVTPKLGGLSGTATYGLKEGSGNNPAGSGGQNVSAGLNYGLGALGVGAAWQRAASPLPTGAQKTWLLSAKYGLGPMTVYGQFGRASLDGSAQNRRNTLGQIGASWDLGSGALLASGGLDRGTGAASYRRSIISLGYDHRLSKRTDLYVAGMRERISDKGSGLSYGVGVRHRF